MDYNKSTLVPYIPQSEYDAVAQDFLELYYPDALKTPMSIPIAEIARDELGLCIIEAHLSEESDIYGMTVFSDGNVEIYNPNDGLYETRFFKQKTVLIDPEAVSRTNTGCKNNTIAHECIHWFKHRMYYRMQKYNLPRQAKYCRCRVNQLDIAIDDEIIMENQAVGIAPRVLMPRTTFSEVARGLGVGTGKDNWKGICSLAAFFNVSKQSVTIRLKECGLV